MSESKKKFSIKDLDCESVVVFQDRAEVKRTLKTSISKGETEIVLTNITSSIDKDSVRVEGHGNACVLDVVCESKSVQIDNNQTNERLQKAKLEIKSLEKKVEETKLRLERSVKKTQIINDFATTLSKPGNSKDKNDHTELASSTQNVENFLSFIDLYSLKLEGLDDEKLSVQNELNDLNEQLRIASENHDRLTYGHNYEEKIEITILLETSQEKSDVSLSISYLVSNASWSPKYDIRVFGKDKSMVINYFGLISQTTGEDWNETKVSLSTAIPSIGGNVPQLETQNVGIKRIHYVYPQSKSFAKKKRELREDECELKSCGLMDFSAISVQQTEVKTSEVGSTSTFEIPRKASIPSDGKTHKVSISIINLSPEFEYETVPRKNTHAYIKAKVKNTSEYALLAGPANVFLDNNFVSKSDLKSYSPQEELDLSLGVDPAIKIEYKPVRKYKESSGFKVLNKTVTTTYVQVIEVKNTSQNKAKVFLIDNLPLSSDDKVKVKLLEPVLKNNSNFRLNKSNNLEFDLVIDPGKKEEITIKYLIESPSDKEVEFY